jgi:hypothetical protein
MLIFFLLDFNFVPSVPLNERNQKTYIMSDMSCIFEAIYDVVEQKQGYNHHKYTYINNNNESR